MKQKHSEQAEALREAEELLADERSAKERAEQQREQTHQQEIRRLQQRMQDLEAEKNNTQAFGVCNHDPSLFHLFIGSPGKYIYHRGLAGWYGSSPRGDQGFGHSQ